MKLPDHISVPCPLCEKLLRVDLIVSTDIGPGRGPGGSGRTVTIKIRQALIRSHKCIGE